MSLNTLQASQALAQLEGFDAIVDARTPLEYALDHLPGAVNWPSLDDNERVTIGTMYKQVNPFEAKKRGAALVARNVARHIERELLDAPRNWRPLVYCWRGGNRSGALATILSAIGFQVTLLEGGYKAFRQALLADLPQQAQRLRYRVVCGPTGSGKTRLLHALRSEGAQVLDLEALAQHRSSVLGHIPGVSQPSQKHFDTLVWHALCGMSADRPVYIESESKKVGNVSVPDALMDAMRASACIDLRLETEQRVSLLLEDYRFFVTDPEFFCQRLLALTERRGKAQIGEWVALVNDQQTPAVVRSLLTDHYDPMYAQSIGQNFVQFGHALPCLLQDRSAEAMTQSARWLIASENQAEGLPVAAASSVSPGEPAVSAG